MSRSVKERFQRLLTAPQRAVRRYRKIQMMRPRERAVREGVARTPPMRVETSGPAHVHIMCSRDRLHDGIASVKSFYRFAATKYPLVFHDDGSMRQAEFDLLERHFPGVRIIPRKQADAEVGAYLAQHKMHKLIDLRKRYFATPKLLDFIFYCDGASYLQMDSDILCFKPPTDLFGALEQPAGPSWLDRYNQDIQSAYSWSFEDVKKYLGIECVPSLNSGLVAMRREMGSFEFYEDALRKLEPAPMKFYFAEQSLIAIESSRRGCRALPPDYDVLDRLYSTGERDLTTQHYCGQIRPRFYDDFCQMVLPALVGSA